MVEDLVFLPTFVNDALLTIGDALTQFGMFVSETGKDVIEFVSQAGVV